VRADRIHIVTPGIEAGPSEPGPDVAWPTARGLRLLFLSSMIERKRPDLALRTLAVLRANGREASLVMAGRGSLERRLRRLARSLGVADVVAWHAPAADEKWALYDSADVLLFPSRLEGFGLVVAEAQSRGLPAVVAAGTATEEIVDDGETGFVVPPTADSFAAAVGRLAGGSVRAAFGERARIAAARWDWERAAAQTVGILRDVAAG
jgi:glycosyltransferase involved in cell wall biosynthesis